MRNVILLFFIFQTYCISGQEKKNLYLLFEHKKDKMYLHPYYKKGIFDVYTYNVCIFSEGKKYYSEIYFDSQIQYINENPRTELTQKKITFRELKKLDVRDFSWLEKKINSISYGQLYVFYKKMYIVEIDSVNKKAILTEVFNAEIIE